MAIQNSRHTENPALPGTDHSHQPHLRNISVFCIYENPLYLDRICRALEEKGDIQVEIAVSLEDALHLMIYVPFDVVITDCISVNNETLGLLKTVRRQKKDIPFVYFGRDLDPGILAEASVYGNFWFLLWGTVSEGHNFDELARLIHRIIPPECRNLPGNGELI